MAEQKEAQRKYLKESEGKRILLMIGGGEVVRATVRHKKVNCGKTGCTKCPHETYAYAQYRDGERVFTKYLGRV